MKVIVSGQHMNVGESLQTYIEQHLLKNVKKYFEKVITCTVTLTMEKQHYVRTDILINEGTGKGLVIKSTSHDSDAHRSFDQALNKAESQMRKHHGRMKEHQKISYDKMPFFEATKYTISPLQDADESEGNSPVIIAEKVTEIEELSLNNAVMKMDLEDLSTYVFTNSGTKRLNVIYYRNDGNIAWIDIPSK